jgi:hypothetical protein
MAPGGNRVDRLIGQSLIVRNREGDIRIDDIDQLTGDTVQLRLSRLVRADITVAEDLARVERDQFAAQPLGDRNRQRRLSAGRGSDDAQQPLPG